MVGLPSSIKDTSVEVPPISKPRACGCPASDAMNAAPDTPPAGPDSIVCTGDWLARSTLIRPPSERTMLTLDWN